MTRILLAAALAAVLAAAAAAQARTPKVGEYRLPEPRIEKLRAAWLDQVSSRHGSAGWAPAEFELGNPELRRMGLPRKRVLLSHNYRVPKAVYPDGRVKRLAAKRDKGGEGGKGDGSSSGTGESPGLISYAGAGFFGIRPGAWLLMIDGNSIGWCSMAHVYGTPGDYAISTAGHCGKPGDTATVIGALGNREINGVPIPVLIDFGRFAKSHDGGLGNDWALISVAPRYQHLVTPTMAFWGGPVGMYEAEGEVLDANLNGPSPSISANPDPALVQQLVHYGHGTGVGAGGTPRSATAITWGSRHFMFFGAITPGDSGSGANTLTGDTVGSNREAAGILTHLWIDSRLREGVGIMGGTRATQVRAPLANGQILPYPAPAPLLP